ncbi:hypothetical protein, partial [Salmonella enterica]|uniref:hypothetical protein n=1 Tax=Salmonella enterica TaxID=28901 RepID=UPI0035257351
LFRPMPILFTGEMLDWMKLGAVFLALYFFRLHQTCADMPPPLYLKILFRSFPSNICLSNFGFV